MKYNETYRGSYCWVQVALWLIGSINKMVVKLIGSISSCISVIRCIHDYFSFSFTIASLDWKGIYIYIPENKGFSHQNCGVFPSKLRPFHGFPVMFPLNQSFPHQIGEVSIKLARFPVVFPTALARPGLVRRPRALLLVLPSGQC